MKDAEKRVLMMKNAVHASRSVKKMTLVASKIRRAGQGQIV